MRLELLFFFFTRHRGWGGGLKVNCHRSHRGSSWVKILETFPLNQDTMARFHRSALQLPRGLNTSVCLLDGVVPLATKPRPLPQSMQHLMLMFKWAYWFSTTVLLIVCVQTHPAGNVFTRYCRRSHPIFFLYTTAAPCCYVRTQCTS